MHKLILQTRHFLSEEIVAQKDTYILWWPVFLAIGIGVYFAMPSEPLVILAAFPFLIMLSTLILFPNQTVLKALLFLLLLSCLGFFLATLRTYRLNAPMLEKEISYAVIDGDIITKEFIGKGHGSRVVLGNLEIEKLKVENTPKKIRIRIRKDTDLTEGQRISFAGRLMPPSEPVLPGGYDFQRTMFFKQIGAVGFSYTKPKILSDQHIGPSFISRIKTHIHKRLETYMSTRTVAIAKALLTADRAGITKSDKNAMRDAGLSHILAISGLHIGLFSGIVFFISRLLLAGFKGIALNYPIKKISAIIAFFAAFLYAALAGFPIPTQRALIMIGVVYFAVTIDRWPFSLRLIALAAFLVLLFSPETLISVSFQLSFAAVTGLIWFFEWLKRYWASWNTQTRIFKRTAIYFLGVVCTSFIATIMTAPIVLYHFGQISVVGLLANTIVVPMMAFMIMPLAVVALFVMPFGFDRWILPVIDYGISIILDTAYWFSNLSFAIFQSSAFPFTSMIAFIMAVLILMFWQGRLKITAIGFFAIAVSMVIIHKPFDILIAPYGKILAYYNNQTLYLSSLKKEKYIAEKWQIYYGGSKIEKRVFPIRENVNGIECDHEACRIEMNNKKVTLVKTAMAARQDCTWAEVMIVMAYLNDTDICLNPNITIINQYDIKQNGAYGLKLNDNKILISNNKNIRGKRPWVYYPESKIIKKSDDGFDLNDSGALDLLDSLEF